jgi:hypothetical protein
MGIVRQGSAKSKGAIGYRRIDFSGLKIGCSGDHLGALRSRTPSAKMQ